MKKTIAYTFLAAAIIGSSLARTWTSADGTKTFEGDFVSGDSESVTVKKNGKKTTFKLSLLSEADQTWTKETIEKTATAEADAAADAEFAKGFAKSDLGKFLKKTKKFDGRKYKTASLETVPEYFLFYYSASW